MCGSSLSSWNVTFTICSIFCYFIAFFCFCGLFMFVYHEIHIVPVRSSILTDGLLARISIHLTAVSWFIISLRFGDDSTWQWLHAWLQYNPMLICICSVGFLVKVLGVLPKRIHDAVYSIQHYVIKFVIDLRQVGGFHRVLWFPSPIKLTAKI